MSIEYRVRPITRYIVTRYEGGANSGSTTHGTYESEETAYEVGVALAKAERERLELPIGDMGVIFPAPVGALPAAA